MSDFFTFGSCCAKSSEHHVFDLVGSDRCERSNGSQSVRSASRLPQPPAPEPTCDLVLIRAEDEELQRDGVITSSAAYREGVRHLRLSIHRLEESQVAGNPRWGQAEDGAVVVEGDLQHRVFCLSTERF